MSFPDKKSKAKFVSRFLLAAVLFVVANAALGKLTAVNAPKLKAENFQDISDASQSGRPCSWWLTRAYLREESAPDIVLFGSSQMGCLGGADARFRNRKLDFVIEKRCKIFEAVLKEKTMTDASAFVCAAPGQMISDHFLVAKTLFALRKPRLVVITLAPRDFIDNFLADVSSTEPYRFYLPYLSEDAQAKKLLLTSWPEQLKDGIGRLFPLKNVSQLISWSGLLQKLPLPAQPAQSQERDIGWLFSVNANSDLMHPYMCMTLPKMPNNFKDNTLEYSKRYHNCNPPLYRQELGFLNELLQYTKDEQIKVLVVAMPLTAMNRALLPQVFWTNYKVAIQTACAQHQAKLLDLSQADGFAPTDFIDTVHLSQDGGVKLVDKITEAIAQEQTFKTALNHRTAQLASEKAIEAVHQ
jgi:hypothetical protein